LTKFVIIDDKYYHFHENCHIARVGIHAYSNAISTGQKPCPNNRKTSPPPRASRQLAQALTEHETTILAELNAAQGKPADIGGYYLANDEKLKAVMRPNAISNKAVQMAS
jgi:hypothetical protein